MAFVLMAKFRVRNAASGPEIDYLSGLNGPLLPKIPLEKVGGEAPDLSKGFCGRRGPFRPPKLTISSPAALLRNLK